MAEYSSGAYFIKRKNGGGGRGAALLVIVLLVLTAGIILLAVFLPKKSEDGLISGAPPANSEKKFYYLVTGESGDITTALLLVQECSSRGGAGYLYNDGIFRSVAAVYDRESDVKELTEVNEGASYFSLAMPPCKLSGKDSAALNYAFGEFNEALYNASRELDRGKMSDAAADFAVSSACRKLKALSLSMENAALARAFDIASEYDAVGDSRTLLSYIRFVQVRATVEVYYALSV
ncbi:MAG: hypothetical protein J1F39_02945 [Clostridiales bacterium]|nr:hypothetical protein [Clostridiales bacterium]